MDLSSPIHNSPAEVSVILAGALDQYKSESLKDQMLNAIADQVGDQQRILIDMTAVDHIDASCLQVLLASTKGQKTKKLAITGAIPSVRQWIRIAGADELFDFSEGNE